MSDKPEPRRLFTFGTFNDEDASAQDRFELMAEVVVELEVDDHVFALLTPAVPIIHVAALEAQGDDEEEEDLVEVDDETLKRLTPHVEEALSTWKMKVAPAGEWTVLSRPLPPDLVEAADHIMVDMEGEEEEFLLLTEVDVGDAVYCVLAPATPEYWAVEVKGNEARLLEDDELEKIWDLMVGALDELHADDEDDEDDGDGDDLVDHVHDADGGPDPKLH